jgi:TetR/AcrR family transcriptional regulator, tetracycline repressor protein
MRLKRETIVQGALELLDEVGLDEFTTRRLADRLRIQSPTLYWHFKSKRALLDAMAYAMLRQHDALPVPAPGADWRAWWRESAHSFRRALLSHRDGARIHAGTLPNADQLPRAEAMMRLLRSAGFAPEESLSIMMALSRFVVGWVLEEQAANSSDDGPPVLDPSPERFPLLSEALRLTENQSPDAAFDFGLSLFLASLHSGDRQASRRRRRPNRQFFVSSRAKNDPGNNP